MSVQINMTHTGLDKKAKKKKINICDSLKKMSLEEEEESKPTDAQPRCLYTDVKCIENNRWSWKT